MSDLRNGFRSFVGMAVLLAAGSVQAQDLGFDQSHNYICEGCTDWQSAQAFVNDRVVDKRCSTPPSDPNRPGFGLCSGPDERAVVLHPETLDVFTFIIHRNSMARENLPPMVFRAASAISADEIEELRLAWGVYQRYEHFISDVAAYHQQLIEQTHSTHSSSGVQSDGDDFDPDSCPEGTALSVLADRNKFRSVRNDVIDWARQEYASQFDDDTTLVLSSVKVGINTGFLSATANFDVNSSGYQVAEGYEVEFDRMESWGRRGWRRIIGESDFLWFDFAIGRTQTGRVAAHATVNPAMSQVHGEYQWLTDAHNPADLDPCTRYRLTQAYLTGNAGAGAGSLPPGWSGSGLPGAGGGGSDFRVCDDATGVCCSVYDGTCYDEDGKEIR